MSFVMVQNSIPFCDIYSRENVASLNIVGGKKSLDFQVMPTLTYLLASSKSADTAIS